MLTLTLTSKVFLQNQQKKCPKHSKNRQRAGSFKMPP